MKAYQIDAFGKPTLSLTSRPPSQRPFQVNTLDICSLTDIVGYVGMNPIIACATHLLTIVIQLKRAKILCNLPVLHQKLTEAVVNFEKEANERALDTSGIEMASYLLCALLDEVILNQQMNEQVTWDNQADWSKKSLVSTFYQDVWGGEVFFEIVERFLQNTEQNRNNLELVFFCLHLGFEGKYRIMESGQEHLQLLREKIYIAIHQKHDPSMIGLMPESKLFLFMNEHKKPWMPVAIAGVILAVALFSVHIVLNRQLDLLFSQFEGVLQPLL